MDEPFNALDKKSVEIIENLIIEEKKKGKIIFLTSHGECNIEKLCDEVLQWEKVK